MHGEHINGLSNGRQRRSDELGPWVIVEDYDGKLIWNHDPRLRQPAKDVWNLGSVGDNHCAWSGSKVPQGVRGIAPRFAAEGYMLNERRVEFETMFFQSSSISRRPSPGLLRC